VLAIYDSHTTRLLALRVANRIDAICLIPSFNIGQGSVQ
jgi:hypothetical protein